MEGMVHDKLDIVARPKKKHHSIILRLALHLITGPTMDGKSNLIRGRITSVKNTKKITEAMRLVAAAKVRRAQEAVLSTRPFNEGLQSVFSGLVKRLALENIELPLLQERPVKKVTVVVMTGDRGLCGGYNAKMVKLAEKRIK